MGKKAFSLVEFLVVISIVALLTAILMPSVVGARRQANRVYCLNNLRQMAFTADSYAQSNNDYYPIAQYSWQENVSTTFAYCWDFTNGKRPIEKSSRADLGRRYNRKNTTVPVI